MGLRELLGQGKDENVLSMDELRAIPADQVSPSAIEAMQNDRAWTMVEAKLKQMNKNDVPRREAAENRRRLFEGRGLDLAKATIEAAFADRGVQDLYKAFAPFARVNYLRRKTRERSRLYAKAPRVRKVAGERDNENYQWLLKATKHNAAMKFADETTDYQNDTFWLFRIRETPRGREPRTDILGPELMMPICDPDDRTKFYGIAIKREPLVVGLDDTARSRWSASAHWFIWTDDESMQLDAKWSIIRESIRPNPFGRIPGVLVNNGYRDRMLLDPYTGEEAVSTHLSLQLQETAKLKGIMSKTRQAVFTGETGNSPQGQSQDDTRDMVVAEGVGVTTIERGIDINQFTAAMDHTEERAASAEGIPPQVLRHAGATSGYEMDLRRIPLEEIREDRVDIFRDAEREYAEVMSAVVAIDLPERRFSTEGWHMDFSEIKRPMPEKEKWEVRAVKRKMGHSDPVLEAMEDNPDFTKEMAEEWIGDRMQVQATFEDERAKRNSTGNPLDDNQTPEENGAMAQDMTGAPAPGATPDASIPVELQEVPVPGQKNGKGAPKIIATDVQATALNGAQVTSMVDVITKVAAGEISRESAKAIMLTAFPTVDEERAEQLLGPAEFEPRSQEETEPPTDSTGN